VVAQRLADQLARRGGPVRQRPASGLRELSAVDRAIYAAAAAPLARHSLAANG
jgi:hypothetical protein